MCTHEKSTAQCVATYTPAGSDATCVHGSGGGGGEGLKGSWHAGESPAAQQWHTGNGATAEAVDGIITAAQLSGNSPAMLGLLSQHWLVSAHQQESGESVARVLQPVRLGLAAACGGGGHVQVLPA